MRSLSLKEKITFKSYIPLREIYHISDVRLYVRLCI